MADPKGEGLGCALMILSAGITIFLVLWGLSLLLGSDNG